MPMLLPPPPLPSSSSPNYYLPSHPRPPSVLSHPLRSQPLPLPPAMSSSSPPPRPDDDDGAQEVGASDGRSLGYGEAEYWDARYVEEGGAPYDWYQRYDALRPFVRCFAPPASRILMVGCGSALMSEDMVTDGYVEIVNIDISSVVIEMMRKKYFDVPQLQCIL
ncbi:Endothelin-converting enzyme 2 [Zea mays]|uniref:Endothelin-converting enzyme 2 n=2 Tax=Zea mays TaxID=4577 RepID=A0A8J8YJX9_MAIZE|nr:S-adenosyl-L-methionine-dependent methyltransferase superfamily protein [Zea mays]PWZ13361.1 Endothelin-converting enzyme 2 [Zea mays]